MRSPIRLRSRFPTSPGPRQSVRPRRRPGLPSVSGRAGSLVLFRSAYANAAARTKSRRKVLEITVIRRVLLSFYGETPPPHLRWRRRLMMHLGATFSSAPGDLTSMQQSHCESRQFIRLITGRDHCRTCEMIISEISSSTSFVAPIRNFIIT